MAIAEVTGHVRRVPRTSGARLYFAWRDLDGRQHQKLLGREWTRGGDPPRGSLTKKQAKAIARDRLSAMNRDPAPTAPGDVAPELVTFRDASAGWLRDAEVKRACKHSTMTDYRLMVRRLDEDLGDMVLTSIDTDYLRVWLDNKRDDGGWSNRTVQKYGVVLHGILEWARKDGKVTTNAAADLEPPKVRNRTGVDDFYTSEEVWALVRAAGVVDEVLDAEDFEAAKAAAGQDAAIFLTAAFTGLRMGELLALRWRNVDFARRSIRVTRGFTLGVEDTPKSGSARTVPMARNVENALARLGQRPHFAGDGDLVFCGELGGHLNPGRLRKRYRAAQSRAGLRPLRFHDLRHTFGTLAVDRAKDLLELMNWMGHAQLATTERYLHFKDQGDGAARLDDAFDEGAPTGVDALVA